MTKNLKELADRLNISLPILELLLRRGVNLEEIELFIQAGLRTLYNPFLLPDMEKACVRLRKAIAAKEHIHIHGDGDVDGITSVAIAVNTLKSLHRGLLTWYIPDASADYGFTSEALSHSCSANLIICVDCGTRAYDTIEKARSLNIDVIVADHHEPGDSIANPLALINPKLQSSKYPFKNLAGCAVTFKLCQALALSFEPTFRFNELLCVIDFETTGLNPENSEIIEIGAVKLKNFVPVDEFHAFIKPENFPSEEILRITGIKPEDILSAKKASEVMPDFISFISNNILVAHNAKFDMGFLNKYCKIERIVPGIIDTLELSRMYYPEIEHSLIKMCSKFNIKSDCFHRALFDAKATAKLLEYIMLDNLPSYRKFIIEYLDYMALGTIADVVELLSENRTIVKWGLKALKSSKKPGIRALIEKTNLQSKPFLTAADIGYVLAPRLNAPARMGVPHLTYELLLAKNCEEASVIASEIEELNLKRQKLTQKCLEKIEEQIDENVLNELCLIFYSSEIPRSITGVIANRLSEKYNKPVIILADLGSKLTGSARAPGHVNIRMILENFSDLFESFGGHEQAAGIIITKEKFKYFQKKLQELEPSMFLNNKEEFKFDLEIKLSDLTEKFLGSLMLLEPFGTGFENPVFLTKGAIPTMVKVIGKNFSHLKLIFLSENGSFQAIGFNMAELAQKIIPGETKLDILYSIKPNWFNNTLTYNLMLSKIFIQK